MELYLDRAWKKDTYTVGCFFVNGKRFSDSMEDRDRGLRQDMSLTEIKAMKVYGETAIPTGKYEIRMSYSAKFAGRSWSRPNKGFVPEIVGVPGFSGVRIHPLNSAKDSLGCIGLGKNDHKGWISNSTSYYRDLVDNYIIPASLKGEKIYLTII